MIFVKTKTKDALPKKKKQNREGIQGVKASRKQKAEGGHPKKKSRGRALVKQKTAGGGHPKTSRPDVKKQNRGRAFVKEKKQREGIQGVKASSFALKRP